VVEATCQRVVIIRRGKKVGEGAPRSLRDGEGGVTLFLAGPSAPSAYVEAVTGLSCVMSAEVDAREAAARVVAAPGDQALDTIFAAVVQKGLALRRFESRGASLE